MPKPLHVLLVEDNTIDAELILNEIRAAGFDPHAVRVDTEPAFLDALRGRVEVVVSDFNMPQFSGLQALELLQRRGLEIPFILVSGSIGEAAAVEAIKRGAADYLLKDRLERLGPAIIRAIGDTELRREKARTEDALDKAHAQTRQLLEHSPAVLYALKLDGDKAVPAIVSENITALIGFTPAEVAAPDWWRAQLHPDDHARADASIAETIANGASRLECRIRHKDGNYRWVDDSRHLVRNAAGIPVEIIGVWTDITERKRAEGVLREASGRAVRDRRKPVFIELAILLAAAAALYWVASRFSWFEFFTRWLLSHDVGQIDEIVLTLLFLGVGFALFAFRRWRETEGELAGRQHTQAALRLLHDELAHRVKRRTEELNRANAALRAEIDERRRGDEALRVSEARLRELAEVIEEVFWVTSVEKHQMLYISPAYERVWGRTCQSLYETPRNWLDAILPEDRERVLAAAVTKQAAGTYDEEYRIVRSDGTERWIRDRAFPIRGPDGAIARIVGVAEDITERKKLYEQLLHAQRMEAVGALAGGIAHDLNNILAPIIMGAGLLTDRMGDDKDRDLVKLIQSSAERGSSVVRQLLTFSRGIGGERVAVQLRHLIKEMGAIIHETFPRDIAFSDSIARDLPPVLGDPTQLHQVLMNLCVNARDAMPNGGKLTITAQGVELSASDVEGHAAAKPGPHVALSVADTGTGIPQEIVDRIFEPFFTTKAPGKGTGLGLSTVLGIVRSHHGYLTVESKPREGTTFTIYLPVVHDAERGPAAADPDAPPRGQGELILVIDDEEPIRHATRLTLEQHGYAVATAGEGTEAIAIYVQRRAEIRLVLTDLMMPVMSGTTLIRALRVLEPALPVIATSGLTDQDTHDTLKAAGIGTLLSKPCDPRDMLKAIHRALHR